MIDEFELFRARAYGHRDDSDADRQHDGVGEKSGSDVTSGSQRRMYPSLSLFSHGINWQTITSNGYYFTFH